MNVVDLSPVLSVAAQVATLVVVALVPVFAKRGLTLVEAHLGVKVTDQQNARIADEVATVAGVLLSRISRGFMPLAEVHVKSMVVASAANGVIGRAFDEANALGVTHEDVAAQVVAAVMRMVAADPTISTVQPVTQVVPVAAPAVPASVMPFPGPGTIPIKPPEKPNA